MQINSKNINGIIKCYVSGELDLNTSYLLDEEMEKQLNRKRVTNHVLLVIKEVEFIDSSGIGVLIKYFKKTKDMGGRLILCGAKPQVKRVLDIAGIVKIIHIVDTEKEALQIIEGEKNNESC